MVSGGENGVPFDMWKATSFPTSETKFQVRQNGMWMGTSRRSICDNNFQKHSGKSPGKPLIFSRESLGKPCKRISFDCWPPAYLHRRIKKCFRS